MMTRITDADAIERRMLDFAYTTTAELTPTALAYFAPCSIADASQVLDDLAARGRIQLDVEDNGTLRYTLIGRTALGAAPQTQPLPPPPMPMYQPPMQPYFAPSFALARRPLPPPHHASPTLAGVLSVFVPGAGHAYTGRWLSAMLWFVIVGAAYALIIPGLVLHFFCILSAASSAHRLNASEARVQMQLAAATSS